ncbi:GntR family transcriptional regulator [Propionicicella superfundia]|uniref:GntR family transcriptional regulator n=1 Tax=Propionicicella superfundia TaxID=348582 RepID=UPI000411B7C1|nr:GntR family transcriptional regulator [Propionicicella superfundia]
MPVPAARDVHRRRPLRDDVYRTLRDAIVRGELAPGEQLRDADLGAWLGVSRTPVREALLRLQRVGLVHSSPGRMTIVAPEDPTALQHAQVVAAELHALAVRLATPHLAPADLAAMEAANDRLTAALAVDDAEAAIEADDAFHRVAVAASGNPLLARLLEEVTGTLRRAEFLHFGSLTGAASPAQHTAIIAAAAGQDSARAADLTRENWARLAR